MDSDSEVYFAYGSNLHPQRLRERVPSARLLGLTALPGHRLVYGKRGMDGSGKCTTVVTGKPADQVFGALFVLHRDELPALDAAEGPDYQRKHADFKLESDTRRGFYYEARRFSPADELLPFDWYRDLVVAGAHYHRLPRQYLGLLRDVPVCKDPDAQRDAQMRALLLRMSVL